MSKKKIIVLRVLFTILTAAVMVVIFALSADNAEESNAKSDPVANSILYKIFAFFNLSEEQTAKASRAVFAAVRKTAHFCEYAGLAVMMTSCFLSFYVKRPKSLILAWVLSSVYAVSDEIHQTFVPGRSGRPGDVIIDSLGALTGALFVFLVVTIYFKIKDKKSLREAGKI